MLFFLAFPAVVRARKMVQFTVGSDEVIIPMEVENGVIEVDPEKMHGTPVFPGTRVPVKTMFDYLETGDSIERFLDHFPTVERSQAIALLEHLRKKVLAQYETAAG
jgi:uncharacterized protein (DUF433 family)